MYVCMCNKITTTMVNLAIAECKVDPQDPFSLSYRSAVDQIYDYLVIKYGLGTKCGNCQIFTKQIIRDVLNSDSVGRMHRPSSDSE